MPKLEIPRLPKDELKKVVLGIADGHIITSDQVPQNLVGMVFMPLTFGALTPPDGVVPARPVVPTAEPEPVAPTMPPLPAPPVAVAAPVPPPYPDDAMADVRWGRVPEEDVLGPYRAALAAHEVAMAEWCRTAGDQYERDVESHRTQCAAIQAEHAAAVAEHAVALTAVRDRNSAAKVAYQTELAAWEPAARAVYRDWAYDLGVVYESYDKAGPRGINGYPMFTSLCMLHREDWEVVRAAVIREQKRRESDDLIGGV